MTYDAYRLARALSRFGDGPDDVCPICGAELDPGEVAYGLGSVADHDTPLGCHRCQPLPSYSPPRPPADADGNGTATGHAADDAGQPGER